MDKSDHDKLCGELLVDFVNAKTSDEAGFNFIANVQKVFNFAPQFTSKAQNKFPELNSFFKGISSLENELFCLFIKELDSLKLIDEKYFFLGFEGYYDELESYDYGEGRKLLFICDIPQSSDDDECIIKLTKSKKLNQQKLENLFYKYNPYRYEVIEQSELDNYEDFINEQCADFVDDIFKHIEIGDMILEILHVKKSVSFERYKQIDKMAFYYLNYLKQEHDHIDKIRSDVKDYLNAMIKSLPEGKKFLESVLSVYNDTKISKLYISTKGNIEEHTSFVEPEIFLNHDYKESSSLYFSKSFCKCIYHQIIAYCLVKFLQNEQCKKNIKKCPYCNLYFIAKDNKRKRCYDEICSKEYEKKKKRKQREDDPVTYL